MSTEDEKTQIVRDYKLTKKDVEYFQNVLEAIKKKEIVMDDTVRSGEFEPKLTSLLEKQIQLSELSLEMNLAVIRNMLAVHTEHQLETEIASTKMKDNLNQTLASLGFDEKSFKRMFGNEGKD